MTRIRCGAALVSAVLVVGCALKTTAPPEPHLSGMIVEGTDRLPSESTPARIWVAVDPRPDADTAGLHVWPRTEIVVQQADGSYQSGSVHDLVAGARFRAWHDGSEIRSIPPQYRVMRIEVW
jgi:hypothetical protein